jgi:trehalose 2-sulfotransferase
MGHELSYFLCATPRSGTTMLCDLLAATGRAGRPQSYFRRQDIERRARGYGLRANDFAHSRDFDRAYLDAVLREGAGDSGIFGLRIMWGTVAEMAERLSALRPDLRDAELFESLFGRIVYVHVSRGDKVAQAISLLKAELSGLWHVAADGSERQRTAPPARPSYDPDRIAELVGELEQDEASWNAFFAANEIAPVRIEYEALAAAPRVELQKILVGMNLPAELADAVEVRTSKMADAESGAWADRFRRARGA